MTNHQNGTSLPNGSEAAPLLVEEKGEETLLSWYSSRKAMTSKMMSGVDLRSAIHEARYLTPEGITLADLITEARRHLAEGNKEEYKRLKEKSPAITPAVLCHPTGGHRQENIARYTGLVIYDMDKLATPERAREMVLRFAKMPYTYAAWVTTSGCGVRLLLRYLPDAEAVTLLRGDYGTLALSPADYKHIWLHGQKEVERVAGCKVDASTKDPTRLSYLCHDAEAYFDLSPHTERNSLPIPIAVLRPQPAAKSHKAQPAGDTFTTDAHTLATRWLQQRGLHYAEGSRNTYLFSYACSMCRLGAPEEESLRHAQAMTPALPQREAETTVGSAYRHVRGSGEESTLAHLLVPRLHGKGGRLSPTQRVLALLPQCCVVRHNRLTEMVELCEKQAAQEPNPLMRPFHVVESSGRVMSSLWHYVNTELNLDMSIRKLYDLLHSDALSVSYDPLREYLDYCHGELLARYADRPRSQWHPAPPYRRDDGSVIAVPWSQEEDEIGRLFGVIHSDLTPADLHWIGAKWLVGMMATALCPDKKGHLMLILQGPGGTGKTNFFRALAPPHAPGTAGLLAVTNMARFTNKNEAREVGIMLSKCLLVLVDEFTQPTATEAATLKEAVTCSQIDKRFLHTDYVGQMERKATLCGTTNDPFVLNNDSAEQRRLVPIHVDSIDHYGYLERLPLNHTLLYGQAVWLLRQGLQHWLTPADFDDHATALAANKERFTSMSQDEEMVQTYFYPANLTETPCDPDNGLPLVPQFMTATEVRNHLADIVVGLPHAITNRTLAKALVALGYPCKKVNGKRGYYLIAKPYTTRSQESAQAAKEMKNM